MKIMFLAATAAMMSAAVAQSLPPSPEIQAATIQVLQAQRNGALDQVAFLAAQLQIATMKLSDLQTAVKPKPDAGVDKKEGAPR
jgi:multidrug resistance efflux pump